MAASIIPICIQISCTKYDNFCCHRPTSNLYHSSHFKASYGGQSQARLQEAVLKRDKYVGDWKNELKNGKGFFLTIHGKLYEGDWLGGFRHGFGLLSQRLSDGTYRLEYRGDWVRGKPHGIGWRYYENGDIFFGFWQHGRKNGFGKMWYQNGTFYVGYWTNDDRAGLGMFVQENGNRYEGHWQDNVRSGLGRFYHLGTGQLQEGCWVADVCVKSKMEDIIIRQFAVTPTEYPIPPVELVNSVPLLESSQLWLQQRVGDIDKQLKFCIE